MKLLITIKWRHIRLFFATIGSCILLMQASSQVCTDPGNVIFGINGTGNIFPVNINTGNFGAQLNPIYPGNAPSAPNGIGFSLLNGKFYYFKRSPSSVTQEFVSFDPATNAITILSSCPTANSVYVGCVANNGLSYYCWDSQSRLFYYRIATDTWTMITTAIVDQFGKDVDSIFRAHGSGDAAIDGMGNFLMLPSSNSGYGLYKSNAPLPTTPVASLTVKEIIPMSNPPAKFVGIALNATGQIILSTSSPSNRIYRLENNLTLTLLSTMAASMDDFTSCNFPMYILPLSFKDFRATLKNHTVTLSWEITGSEPGSGYSIQHSTNAVQWVEIEDIYTTQYLQTGKISFNHQTPATGKNYYRLVRKAENEIQTYSEIETVFIPESRSISIWPNPVQDFLVIQSPASSLHETSLAAIFDLSGRKIKDIKLVGTTTKIDIRSLDKGNYLVSLQSMNGEKKCYSILKR